MTALDDLLRERYKEEEALYQTIQAEEQQEFRDLADRLGRWPNTSDAAYWQISEKYRQRYFDEISNPRKKLEKEIKKQEKEDEPEKVPTTIAEKAAAKVAAKKAGKKLATKKDATPCRDCGGDIPPTGKPGRPPVRCPECKAKNDEEKKAKKDDVEVIMFEVEKA